MKDSRSLLTSFQLFKRIAAQDAGETDDDIAGGSVINAVTKIM